jgi:hypothetical protein
MALRPFGVALLIAVLKKFGEAEDLKHRSRTGYDLILRSI